jgi:hypothetical protein
MGALSAGTQIIGGIQAMKAGGAQANAYQAAAGMAREQAGMEIGASDYQANQMMAQARTSAAAGGVDPGTGSAKIVNMMNASEAMLRDTATRYGGNLRAASDLAEAANARLQGKQALYGSIAKAAGSALTTGIGITAPTGAGGLGYSPF